MSQPACSFWSSYRKRRLIIAGAARGTAGNTVILADRAAVELRRSSPLPRSPVRDEGGAAMIAVLEAWEWPSRQALAAVREEVLTYFRNQMHRMDYPTYEAKGWFIGSGAVESACKTVVGQRLKGSGMRWGESGGNAVCHVRALYRSERGQRDAFWDRCLAA